MVVCLGFSISQTVLYRILSKALGFRMVIGNLGRGGAPPSGDGSGSAASGGVDYNMMDGAQIPPSSPENEGRRAQFGEAVVIDHEKNGDNSKRSNASSYSSSSDDISRTSHESEMPLNFSMAT
ncbi:hypothetical protein COLO4_28334 [Corchorus olitorius]|uniref:Uncharacterized protein n=1 Tax=Corchorus olitorius TaxID=93759 RepID=A0A1R3HLZ3_9ROSI|nr:hypothetical protein COLO4_28334 [Corchorus olitorius]